MGFITSTFSFKRMLKKMPSVGPDSLPYLQTAFRASEGFSLVRACTGGILHGLPYQILQRIAVYDFVNGVVDLFI